MASVTRLVLLGCLAGGLLLGPAPVVKPAQADHESGEAGARDLEPIPRVVAFSGGDEGRFQEATREQIEEVIQRTFASLGDVRIGRERLVRRFGVISMPALVQRLKVPQNVTATWNVLLTVGALRDVEGAALEIKSALKHMVPLLEDRGNETHVRAFAALGLGCFPWPESVVPRRYGALAGYYTAVPGPARATEQAARSLVAARRALVTRVADKHIFSAVSALFALAKMGGEDARKALFDRPLPQFANPAPKRALLLARAFLVQDEGRPFLQPIGKQEQYESPVRAAAALAIAVALLQEQRAKWTEDGQAILRQLKTGHAQARRDDENVFARGVCAYQFQLNDEWDALWKCAMKPSTKPNCAAAACQMLGFCELPHIRRAILKQAGKRGDSQARPVLALALLRAGSSGTAEGLAHVRTWLHSAAPRPSSDARWDPRWYAAIGLLRAFHQGNISGKKEREEAVASLRKALKKPIHKGAAIRPVLARVLDAHADRITRPSDDAPLYRLPYAALREVQESFTCPYGLLADDPVEACVRRVNRAMTDIYELENLPPNKPGEKSKQPERNLKRYLAAYPYFSRLEFLAARGFRPLPGYGVTDDPLVIDR